MVHPIHLAVVLDDWRSPIDSLHSEVQAVGRLLEGWGGSALTLLTRRLSSFFMETRASPGNFPPHHLVAGGGSVLFHHRWDGTWERDPSFSEWYAFSEKVARLGPFGTAPQDPNHRLEPPGFEVALDFLEIFFDTPRPLLLFGNPLREPALHQQAEIALPVWKGERAKAESRVRSFLRTDRLPAEWGSLLNLLYPLGSLHSVTAGAESHQGSRP